ncbi:hypothetical protein F2Q70_00030086 [Brassica cretica]|uniref:Uncharacterized protein n=2 Tax=Brassica cretica TaxID=69181 RepID=A0A8S9MSJ9_BRACR|nr:hypothetical protein F2Q70_00030086 [Brassica cretica]KAF2553147.1 hypothetical protein F2Q68_00034566 [Brassica cretica]KAF3484868.1 hypothetical protein F2Q69_00053352 [Brassica cretica]KAF3592450.1 hypothetical protein DY000_02022402 [Brassica cretica]
MTTSQLLPSPEEEEKADDCRSRKRDTLLQGGTSQPEKLVSRKFRDKWWESVKMLWGISICNVTVNLDEVVALGDVVRVYSRAHV